MVDETADPIRVGPVRTPRHRAGRLRGVNYPGLLRVVLPLAAFALVAAIFFGSTLFGDDQATTSVAGEIGDLRGSRGVNATFSGVTPDGYAYNVRAAEARPDGLDATRLELDDFRGVIALEGERSVTMTAPTGLFLRSEETARLNGGVVVATSDGYRVETESIAADTGAHVIRSDGRVLGYGPAGRICAESMTLDDAEGGVARFDGDVVVVLTDLPGAGGADGATALTPPADGEEQTACQRAVWALGF